MDINSRDRVEDYIVHRVTVSIKVQLQFISAKLADMEEMLSDSMSKCKYCLSYILLAAFSTF